MEGIFVVIFRFLGERELVCFEFIIMYILNGVMVLFVCMFKIYLFLFVSLVVRSIYFCMWVFVV